MVRKVYRTNSPWDEWSMARIVYTWYVRIVNGTNSLVIDLVGAFEVWVVSSQDIGVIGPMSVSNVKFISKVKRIWAEFKNQL